MSNTKFTPGPWVARIDNYGIDVIKDDDSSFGIVLLGTRNELKDFNYPIEQAEANAKLIAAAPELLEALLLVIECFPEPLLEDQMNEEYFKVKAAIKKATD